MYTLEQLREKTFKKLKEIGYQLDILPAGDRRCRQNWIDAIAGVKPPLLELLELLEASPGVEVEPVAEAIEVQRQELTESKFGRIVYPRRAAQPIAPAVEQFDAEEFQQTHAAEIDAYVASFTDDRPPNRGTGDRGRLENEPILSQSAIAPAVKNPPGVDRKTSTAHELLELFKSSAVILEPIEIQHQELIENSPGVTFSSRFLALYSPPKSENVHYQVNDDGQLSLLDFEVESVDEPPDFDDYSTEFEFWAAYDAWIDRNPDDIESLDGFSAAPRHWDAENLEPPAVSMDSMCEWTPCPEDWYEPTAEILPPEASSMKVLELSPAIETIESSSTCEFLIPVFGAAGDRQNDKDEPPNAGSFARLPNPKPPSFPPMGVVAGDRANRIKKFARSAILWSGRSPPGGDASF
ncbi:MULTISPECIES: hypothetical protein [unclassified Microcoleus]|uniref:hypothetical protein n=1 Tax=unclassified Microcoleus TaxID=2642155 RepID=UPI0025FC7E40|nr:MULTISPECIES: hypothetical protein [unclassified Microcoleus]